MADRLMAAAVARFGLDIDGCWVLEVPGRRTGRLRRVIVKPVEADGHCYLVSLRGETAWARNVRAQPAVVLRRGRRAVEVEAAEVPPPEAVPAMREYLRRASRQATRDALGGGNAMATDAHLALVAERHPVFRLQARR